MAYATVEDVAVRLGYEPDPSEAQIIDVRLEDAERLIKAKLPDLDGMILDNEVDRDTVVMIEAEAVLRLIRNPDGFSAETDGNYNYQINSRVASGKLEILEEEWALLGVTRGMFTITPRVCRPRRRGRHPQYDFCPPYYGHSHEHPAVWWGDDDESA